MKRHLAVVNGSTTYLLPLAISDNLTPERVRAEVEKMHSPDPYRWTSIEIVEFEGNMILPLGKSDW